MANEFVVGDGFARLATCATTGAGRGGRISGGRWFASTLRADGGMTCGDLRRRVARASFRDGQLGLFATVPEKTWGCSSLIQWLRMTPYDVVALSVTAFQTRFGSATHLRRGQPERV